MGPHSLDQRVTALETNERVNHSRLCTVETALWGEKRDGEGGIVNKLNAIVIKGTIISGVLAFIGGAIGPMVFSAILRQLGVHVG